MPNDDPRPVDVLCLASSGASAREFARWQAEAGARCRIVPVDLPGRGRKVREAAAATLHDTVGRLLDEAPDDREHVLFGHSFGGLVAYELARRAAAEGRSLPRALVVAACRPPHAFTPQWYREIAERSDGEMLAVLEAAGLVSGALRNSPAARAIVPALREDVRLLAGYVPPPEHEAALPVDVVTWFGTSDRAVPEDVASGWRRYTSRTWSLRAFDGGHFFVREQWAACVGGLVDLTRADPVPPRPDR